MSEYHARLELNPTPNNPLVALTTKIETLVENEANEDIDLAMSALFSALLRLESAKCDGNTRRAAMRLGGGVQEHHAQLRELAWRRSWDSWDSFSNSTQTHASSLTASGRSTLMGPKNCTSSGVVDVCVGSRPDTQPVHRWGGDR